MFSDVFTAIVVIAALSSLPTGLKALHVLHLRDCYS